jgi:hypothetical protein
MKDRHSYAIEVQEILTANGHFIMARMGVNPARTCIKNCTGIMSIIVEGTVKEINDLKLRAMETDNTYCYLEEMYDSLMGSYNVDLGLDANAINIATFIAKESDSNSIALAFGGTPKFTEEKIILAKGLVAKGVDSEIIEACGDFERDDEEVWNVFVQGIKSKDSRVDLLLNWYLNLLK